MADKAKKGATGPGHDAKPINVVHENENWRQRIVSEENSMMQWKNTWGFLEQDRQEDGVAISRESKVEDLTKTLSRMAPMQDYLQKLRSTRKLGSSTTIKGAASSIVGGSRTDTPTKEDSRASTPLLLDAQTASFARSKIMQGVGLSVATTGVDPIEKYKFPMTGNMWYGWRAQDNLEFFGVAQHAKKGLSMEKLYGTGLPKGALKGT